MATSVTYRLRRDVLANRETKNPLLLSGEPAVVLCPNGAIRLKIGDGVHNFNELPDIFAQEVSLQVTIASKELSSKCLELPDDCDTEQAITVTLQNVAQIQNVDWTLVEQDAPELDLISWNGLGIENLVQLGDKLTVTYYKK